MSVWKEDDLERGDNIIKPAYVEEVAFTQGNRRLFRVVFHDRAEREYVWVPRWKDIRWVYERALVFERKQYGETREFEKFLTHVKNYAELLQMLVRGVKNEEDLRRALRLYLEFYDEESYGREHDGFGYEEFREFVELLNLRRTFPNPITLTETLKKILYDFEVKGIIKRIRDPLLDGVYVFRGLDGKKTKKSVVSSIDELRAVMLDELKYYRRQDRLFTPDRIPPLIDRYNLEKTLGRGAVSACYRVLAQLEREGLVRKIKGETLAWQYVGERGEYKNR